MASIIPGRSIETESKKNLFDYYYKYSVKEPKDLIPVHFNGKNYLTLRNEIMNATDNADQVDYSNTDHPIMKMLDRYKWDNTKYLFMQEGSEGNPEIKICISRLKVLRLCELLTKANVKIELNDLMAENIVLSLLVKDSILSICELDFLRLCVKEILREYNRELGDSNDRFPKR